MCCWESCRSHSVRGAVSLPLSPLRRHGNTGPVLPCPALPCPALRPRTVHMQCRASSMRLPLETQDPTATTDPADTVRFCLLRVFHRSSPSPCLLGSGHVALWTTGRPPFPSDGCGSFPAAQQRTSRRPETTHASPFLVSTHIPSGETWQATQWRCLSASYSCGGFRTPVKNCRVKPWPCQERLCLSGLFRQLGNCVPVQAPSKEEKDEQKKNQSSKQHTVQTTTNSISFPPPNPIHHRPPPPGRPRNQHLHLEPARQKPQQVGNAIPPPPTTPSPHATHTHTRIHPPKTRSGITHALLRNPSLK